jgi:aspartate aminotransferase
MYEHIWWGPEPFCSFAAACPELYPRTVTINGVSKSYAMTGWRLGYCGGPAELVAAMATIQGQSTSNASSISQMAAIVALNGPQECVAEMTRAFKARHDLVVEALNAMPGVSCLRGWGTFYAFANVEHAMRLVSVADDNASPNSDRQASVAVVPGSGFRAPGIRCHLPARQRPRMRLGASGNPLRVLTCARPWPTIPRPEKPLPR